MKLPIKKPLLSEMQFGREDHLTTLAVGTFADGSVMTSIQLGQGTTVFYPATLAQAIQLRDFLNRHIDDLALKQTGSLAERSSDAPAQLASVEEIPHTGMGGVPMQPVSVGRRLSAEGCGQPLLKPVGSASHCGHYSDIVDAFPWLCPACRTASTKHTLDRSQP